MHKKENYLEFQNEINERGIEYLIHFTPTINLLSIYEQEKILSRALLEQNDIDDTLLDFIEFLDSVRFDDKHYINLSISSPNYFLFKRFRERTADKPYINWCILKINPKYIYEMQSLFAVTNAASSIAKKTYGISGDFKSFLKLFDNNINSKIGIIKRGNLKAKYPTDVQAEVLVKNQIEIGDILNVCFKDKASLNNAKASFSNYNTENFIVDAALFTNSRI